MLTLRWWKANLTSIKVGILTVNSEYASTAAYNHNWNILPHEKLIYLAVWRKIWNILPYGRYVVIFSGLHWFLMFLPDTDGSIQWSTNPPKEFWHNCLFGEIRSKQTITSCRLKSISFFGIMSKPCFSLEMHKAGNGRNHLIFQRGSIAIFIQHLQ